MSNTPEESKRGTATPLSPNISLLQEAEVALLQSQKGWNKWVCSVLWLLAHKCLKFLLLVLFGGSFSCLPSAGMNPEPSIARISFL